MTQRASPKVNFKRPKGLIAFNIQKILETDSPNMILS